MLSNKLSSTIIVLFFLLGINATLSARTFTNHHPNEAVPIKGIEELRQDMINFAQSHIGIRYRSGGTSLKGFDCSGFTSYVLKYFDFKSTRSSSSQAHEGSRIAIEDAQKGDLIFFGRGKRVQHVAMVVERTVDKLVVVHSTNSQGIVVEDVYQSHYWKSKLLYARDLISSAYYARN